MSETPIRDAIFRQKEEIDAIISAGVVERIEDIEASQSTMRTEMTGLQKAYLELCNFLSLAIGFNSADICGSARQFGAEHQRLLALAEKLAKIEGLLSGAIGWIAKAVVGAFVIGIIIITLLLKLLLDQAGAVGVGAAIIGGGK